MGAAVEVSVEGAAGVVRVREEAEVGVVAMILEAADVVLM